MTPPNTEYAQATAPRIGLIGRGKLGSAIAEELQHSPQWGRLAWAYGRTETQTLLPDAFAQVDVVIECSTPQSARDNVLLALNAGVPVVCGSTGWLEALPEVEAFCREHQGAFLYAANFSIGVNLFFALNRFLAQRMADWPDYLPRLSETHHTAKKDAPSGTAVHLAEDLIRAHPAWAQWHLEDEDANAATHNAGSASSLPVRANRQADVPGTHTVVYQSPIDLLEIRHEALSRRGFAQGALTAANWLNGKTGVFRMPDVLGL